MKSKTTERKQCDINLYQGHWDHKIGIEGRLKGSSDKETEVVFSEEDYKLPPLPSCPFPS